MPRVVVRSNSLPIGAYTCTFEGVEEVDHPEYGLGWKWTFEVVQGRLKGQQAFRTTKDSPTPKNSCGKFLAALAGETPRDELEVDTDEYIGHRYTVMVEASPSGDSTRIGSFAPIVDDLSDVPFA
jgi:hypothetical protein